MPRYKPGNLTPLNYNACPLRVAENLEFQNPDARVDPCKRTTT